MKKKIFVAVLILLAICVGLGIPLAVANVQDAAIAAKSDSLDMQHSDSADAAA